MLAYERVNFHMNYFPPQLLEALYVQRDAEAGLPALPQVP